MTLLPIMPGTGKSRKEELRFRSRELQLSYPHLIPSRKIKLVKEVPGVKVSAGKKRLMITLWLDRKILDFLIQMLKT